MAEGRNATSHRDQLRVGIVFPLGVSSGGLAMLAAEEDKYIDRYLGSAGLESEWGPKHTAASIRERIGETRLRGYAVNRGLLVHGRVGLSTAVTVPPGSIAWSLTITGPDTEFTDERVNDLSALLLNAVSS